MLKSPPMGEVRDPVVPVLPPGSWTSSASINQDLCKKLRVWFRLRFSFA
jgi:hypothetical protein